MYSAWAFDGILNNWHPVAEYDTTYNMWDVANSVSVMPTLLTNGYFYWTCTVGLTGNKLC
jgi:hypothetical protein